MQSTIATIAYMLIVSCLKGKPLYAPIWEILAAEDEKSFTRYTDLNKIIPMETTFDPDNSKSPFKVVPEKDAQAGKPHYMLYVRLVKADNVEVEDKDPILERLNNQAKLAKTSKNIVKYLYVDREVQEDKAEWKGTPDEGKKLIHYVNIEEQQITNLNNYVKKAKPNLEERVMIMQKMASTLHELHKEGIKHCQLYIKKFAVMPDMSFKVRALGGINGENDACISETKEVTDPVNDKKRQNDAQKQIKNKFFEDIYGLAFSFISLIDKEPDAAVKNNGYLNDDAGKAKGVSMDIYIKNMIHDILEPSGEIMKKYDANSNLNKIIAINPIDIHIIETLQKLIIQMTSGDVEHRPSSSDVLGTLNSLISDIETKKSSAAKDKRRVLI